MQKRKIEDSKIWEAYNRIMSGESLTGVANSQDINLDKATLRKYIQLVVIPTLNQQEKSKFEELLNGNFRGNSTENKRQNRNGKRARAAEEIKKSEEMKILADYGVTPAQIEDLYQRLRSDKHTTVSRDTYILKCVEHLTALKEIGFTTEEAFTFFTRRPRLFTSSSSKIIDTVNRIAQKSTSKQIVVDKLKQDPWLDLRDTRRKDTISEEQERGDD